METLRLCNFCKFGARGLEFGTMFTNIILLWIQNFGKNWTTLIPLEIPLNPQNTLNMNLWKLCDYLTFVDLELEVWDLVQCLLISFCFGSKILKKIGLPQPLKTLGI